MNRTISGIMLTLLLIGMLKLALEVQPVKTQAEAKTIYVNDDNTGGPWDGTQEHPYQNITSGIEHAVAGDTIFVYNGTYFENVVVNKDNLTLIGENREATIINGNVNITANNVTVNSFTINGVVTLEAPYRTSGNNVTNNVINGGIKLYYAHSCFIAGNNISTNGQRNGIGMSFSSGIIITSNYIINCYPYQGIDMFGSGGNVIEKNHISDNWDGISLFHSTGNVIIRNVITNNRFSGIGLLSGAERNLLIENLIVTKTYYGECIELWNANNNTLYHNNIISVYALVRISWLGGGTNFWDDGYPSGGNYWSNYTGIDFYSGPYQNETGSDGIGDTPYTIDADNVDRYPLMSPWSPLQVKVFNVTWEDTYYPVSVQSNSTVTHFIFNQTLAQIGFNVSGISGAWGFCNITIPKALMTGPWTYTFQGDVTNIDVYENDNETHTFINLQYKHASTFQVIIKASWVVPEYPSTIILTIFMLTTTVLAVLTKKRRLFMPRD